MYYYYFLQSRINLNLRQSLAILFTCSQIFLDYLTASMSDEIHPRHAPCEQDIYMFNPVIRIVLIK